MKLSAAFLGALIGAATDAGAPKARIVVHPGDPKVYLEAVFWPATEPEGRGTYLELLIAFEGGMGPAQYPPQMIQRHVTAKLAMMLLDAGKNVGIVKGLL